MNRIIEAVKEWQLLFGRKIGNVDHTVSDKLTIVSKETMWARIGFIHEECTEYSVANTNEDTVGVLDAIIDNFYFLAGMVVIHGLQDVFDEAFEIVHEANMSKLWPDGKVHIRKSDGKIIKPPTFYEPEERLKKLLKEYKNGRN